MWKKFSGCLSDVALRCIQRKLTALELLFIIDRVGRLRSQAVDVTDPVGSRTFVWQPLSILCHTRLEKQKR